MKPLSKPAKAASRASNARRTPAKTPTAKRTASQTRLRELIQAHSTLQSLRSQLTSERKLKRSELIEAIKAAERRLGTVPSVELFYFDFCENSLGQWDREWDLSREKLEEARNQRIQNLGGSARTEEEGEDLDGNYGDVCAIAATRVELTPEALLSFALNFAVDQNH